MQLKKDFDTLIREAGWPLGQQLRKVSVGDDFAVALKFKVAAAVLALISAV